MNELADGGLFRGLAVVGEEGPELLDSSTLSRVHSNPDLAAMVEAALSDAIGSDVDKDLLEAMLELLDEVRALRGETRRQTDMHVRLERTF